MTSAPRWVFEQLEARHVRDRFDCGVEALNLYLKTRAGQEQRRNVAYTYVLTDGDSLEVLAFYTLSAASVALTDLPPELAKQLGYRVAPAALIGRLAVDESLRGKGVGKLVLVDALSRIARADLAIMLVLVDPKDGDAAPFYAKFGFAPLGDPAGRMFLPFRTLKALLP